MSPQTRMRRLVASFLAGLLALSALLITSLTWAKPSGTIIVNPGDSIQAAINAANPGDTILINAGMYTESLTLSKAVSLTGISSTTVIIHASPFQRVLTVTGILVDASVVISDLTLTGGYFCDNGAGAYITDGAQPLLQSLIISDNKNDCVFSDGYGGGVYSSGRLTLRNVKFINNAANEGGGLYVAGSNVAVMTNCLFFGNRAFQFGGALINGATTVVNSQFEDNQGGGLRAQSAFISASQFISNVAPLNNMNGGGGVRGERIVAVNSLFERNTAAYNAGGISANLLVLTNSMVISNSAFYEGCGARVDSASISGGAFMGNRCLTEGVWTNWGIGGGLYASGQLTLTNVDFISNSAQTSGGVHAGLVEGSRTTVVGARFERNSSLNPYTGEGGGMTASNLVMTGVKFISNTAPYRGGGLYVSTAGNVRVANAVFADNTTDGNGAGLWLYAGEGTSLINVTIASASLNPKQGIYIFGRVTGVTNTIISNHAVGLERENGYYAGVVFEDYNLFYSNTTNLSGTVTGGTHDVIGNPHFVDPLSNDYHIVPPSAAINAGVDAGIYTDLDGNVRPSGSGFDIGAYEVAIATVPISGLVATNDSPTSLGKATTLTATVEAGDMVSYIWDFGDGSALGNRQTVTHTYPTAGTYTAIVTASNSLSMLTATTMVTVYVTPIADLVAINSSPTVRGQSTAFTATLSAGDLVSYTWDFGDGSATANGITTTHVYPVMGIYPATATAQNSVSVMTATTRVTITDVPITGLVAVNDSPTRLGDETILVAFVQAGDSVSYLWDFGDGSALGTYQAVTHTYPAVGIYTAIVAASNSVSVVTATTRVTVDVPLSGLMAVNDSPTLFGKVTALTATISAGSHVTYTWNFGDSSATASGITATHAYPAGIYTASVIAQNSVSVMTATTRVTITDVPVSGLTATNNSPTTIGNVTTLTATINAGSNVTYTWDFGDGSATMVGQAVTHTYPFSVTSHFAATVTAMNSINTQSATTTIIIVPKRIYLPVVVR